MTLKEKLCKPFIYLQTETLNELEKIADNYALGFEEFKEKYNNSHRIHKQGKELLEIYKKTL